MAVDVVEKDTGFEVKADIPGVDKSDIHVNVERYVLHAQCMCRSYAVCHDSLMAASPQPFKSMT
jgi:hypothetical protein